MTNQIIRKPKGTIGPTESTRDLILEKNVNQIESYQKSGLNNLNQTIKQLSSAQIPNVVEGVVIGHVNQDKKVKYKLISHNANLSKMDGEIEGYCVIVRTALDVGTKTDPELFLESLTKNISEDEKIQISMLLIESVKQHDVIAAISEEERLPRIGEHVKVHYYNSLLDSGEIIKGFYETIFKDNSYFEEATELEKFYKNFLNEQQQEKNILSFSDSNLPNVVNYAIEAAKQLFGDEEVESTVVQSEVLPLNQGDSRWKTIQLGQQNIGAIGCCLTSYTMAHNYLRNPSSPLTPDRAAEIGKSAGGFNYKGYVVHSILAQSLKMNVIGDTRGASISTNQLRELIESGLNNRNAILFHVDWKNDPAGDHWIMCYKKDNNGNYVCNDPAGGKIIIIDKETLTGKFIKSNVEKQYTLRRIIRLGRS